MKRIHTLLLLTCLTAFSTAVAQTPPIPQDQVYINLRTLYNGDSIHVMDGIGVVFGADTFKLPPVPNVTGGSNHPFTDSLNEFDAHKLTAGMTGELFGILRHDDMLILERRSLPGQEFATPYDTTRFFIARLGQGGRAQYSLLLTTKSCTRMGTIRLYDTYLDTYRDLTPTNIDTLKYYFTVVASDAPGTNSKREDRFYMVASKFRGYYPTLPIVRSPKRQTVPEGTMSVYPNPAMHGSPITIETSQQYEQSTTQLYSAAGVLVLQKQNKGKGSVKLDLPSTLTPGTYIVMVIAREGIKVSKKIIVK